MAPEIVFEELQGLPKSQSVLDPMSGSGTVLRGATELGHRALGFDLDPLAVLMAQVWTTPVCTRELCALAQMLVGSSKRLDAVSLPWIDGCKETTDFIDFWFEPKQRDALRKISYLLSGLSGPVSDAIRVALSRIIVTKGKGASIARDSSHSRPHRVYFKNDFDVEGGFLTSVGRLAQKLDSVKLLGSATVQLGDSRLMGELDKRSIDAVITSPPYLNAIDYLRGHRLSLVWFGHTIPELREIRRRSIGAEVGADPDSGGDGCDVLLEHAGCLDALPQRDVLMIKRYASDVLGFMQQLERVMKVGGRVLVVVGNSCLKGVSISNAGITAAAASTAGLTLQKTVEREIPMANRYLPLTDSGKLAARMRTETLLSFQCFPA